MYFRTSFVQILLANLSRLVAFITWVLDKRYCGQTDLSLNSRPPASTPSPSNRRHGTSLLADAVEKKCSYIDVANNQQRNIFSRSLLNSSSLRKASGPGMPSSASIKNKFWRNLPKTEDVRAGRCQRFAKQILKAGLYSAYELNNVVCTPTPTTQRLNFPA